MRAARGARDWPATGLRGAALGLLLRALPLFGLSRADLGNALGDRDLEALRRLARVVEPLHHHARQPLADRALDLAEVPLFFRRHEGEGVTGRVGAGRSTDAVDVILGQ